MVEGKIGSTEEKVATDNISSMVGRTFVDCKDPSRDFDDRKVTKIERRNRADAATIVMKDNKRGECTVCLSK